MHGIAFQCPSSRALIAVLVGCALSAGTPVRGELPAGAIGHAASIVKFSGASGGIGVVAGSRSAELALALASQGGFTVQCLAANPDSRDRLRQEIRAAGLYGTVSAEVLRPGRLPYAENLLNIVIVDSYPALAAEGFSPEEVLRVLAPRGIAYLGVSSPASEGNDWAVPLIDRLRVAGASEVEQVETAGCWVRLRKPWPADIDEWSHYLHDADGNPVAEDRVVGPPAHYQWIAGPRWLRCHETDSSVRTLVTSGGRLFAIVDEAPISLPGDHDLPDQWFLVARDAFNGVLLWKVPIRRWGWREWKPTWFTARPGDFPLNIEKRLVAAGDRVYVTLGYRAPVSQLDARTGELLQTYAGTERTGEILYVDGTLILSVLTGDGLRVIAVDAATGEHKWVSEKNLGGSTVDYIRWATRHGSFAQAELDPSLNTATDGDVVALIDGPEIVALDFDSGAERWRAEFPQAEADRTVGGIQSRGDLWIGTIIVRDGVVVHASPSKLAAFSSATGELLWEQPARYIGHLWYNWKDVFVIDGLAWTWTADLAEGTFEIGGRTQRTWYPPTVNGYDLRTGELKKEVPLGFIFKAHHHHRCYRNKATSRYILASRRGTEYVDLEEGKHTVHNWVRGTCHVGMMPANGLQYVPPHPCVCYIEEKLDGFYALAPARPVASEPQTTAPPVVDRGPAFGRAMPAGAGTDDWPAFRGNAMRTGSTGAVIPDDAAPAWRAELGGRLSPPVAVGESVFVSLIDEHHVVCLDASNGARQWEFAAGGRIDSPPTWYRGTVIFGSADGRVYCLRAEDGALVWRFHAAPGERQIAVFNQLESAWPVHGSVLVQDGTVYLAAGRSSQLDGGMLLYGLDAATGELRHRTKLEGPHYTVGNITEENFRLPMGALPDVLMGDGAKIYMRNRAFDAELNPAPGSPALQTASGFLDDSYFKRAPWRFGDGRNYGRVIVHDERRVFLVRMFDSLQGLDPTVYFTPGAQGYLLLARGVDGDRALRRGEAAGAWSHRIPVRVRAMVLAGDRLLVAGPPDVVDPKDPLGAFEGRKGGLLYIYDASDGERLAEHALAFPPVFNGAAVASGRLFLAEEDGSLTCFGRLASGQNGE